MTFVVLPRHWNALVQSRVICLCCTQNHSEFLNRKASPTDEVTMTDFIFETFYPLAYILRTDCGSNFVLSPWCDSTITSYQCVTIWKENALFLAVKQKGMVWVALVLTFAMPSLFFWGLLHIAIAVAALFPKCQTSSCENISLESKRIYFSDLCSLSIFIPVISPIDCSFWFLQCFVQFLLHLGKIFILRLIL